MSEYRVIVTKKDGTIKNGPWMNKSLAMAKLTMSLARKYAELSGKEMHKVSFETR